MARRLYTEDEAEDLREAGDSIAMAAEALDVAVERFIENVVVISPPPPPAQPFYCGQTTLLGQAQ